MFGDMVYCLDYANNSKILMYREDGIKKCVLMLEHGVNSFDLMELKQGLDDVKSDFDILSKDFEISFGEESNEKHYKAIGTFNVRNATDGKDKKIKLIFNDIQFIDSCDIDPILLDLDSCEVSKFNTALAVNLDENKNFFTMKK